MPETFLTISTKKNVQKWKIQIFIIREYIVDLFMWIINLLNVIN